MLQLCLSTSKKKENPSKEFQRIIRSYPSTWTDASYSAFQHGGFAGSQFSCSRPDCALFVCAKLQVCFPGVKDQQAHKRHHSIIPEELGWRGSLKRHRGSCLTVVTVEITAAIWQKSGCWSGWISKQMLDEERRRQVCNDLQLSAPGSASGGGGGSTIDFLVEEPLTASIFSKVMVV